MTIKKINNEFENYLNKNNNFIKKSKKSNLL